MGKKNAQNMGENMGEPKLFQDRKFSMLLRVTTPLLSDKIHLFLHAAENPKGRMTAQCLCRVKSRAQTAPHMALTFYLHVQGQIQSKALQSTAPAPFAAQEFNQFIHPWGSSSSPAAADKCELFLALIWSEVPIQYMK